MQYFVTAIGTDSGKTLVSAILVEALQADYWKPVQAGAPRDTDTVKSLISNSQSEFHPEGYFLNTPASPHMAAEIDGVKVEKNAIKIPTTSRDLIVEGAGGILVPLNDDDYIIDLPIQWSMEVILVANLYLGSINHTLLSIEYLKAKNVKVAGLIFNGPANEASERIILAKSGYKCLLRIPQLEKVDQSTVWELAEELKRNWNE